MEMNGARFTAEKLGVVKDGNECEVKWNDGHVSRFHSRWLRYNCQCSACARQSVNQLVVDRSVFPEVMKISNISQKGEQIFATLQDDLPPEHVTILSSDWLRSHCYCDICLSSKLAETSTMKYLNPRSDEPKRFFYDKIQDDEGLFSWLDAVVTDGFCIIEGVPRESEKVIEVAESVAPILYQVYGKYFEVYDDGGLENYSNSNKGLHFHMDQPHYESAPGVQLMHFIHFDPCVTGGESMVVDLFRCAEIFREEAPKDFEVLCRVPTVWKTIDLKKSVQSYYQIRKPVIETDYDNQIVAIHWNPGTEEALQVRHNDVEAFYSAYNKFWKIIHRKENQFFFRAHSGDVVVINNRRMAHNRTAFQSNGGRRFMQTTYLSIDELRRRYVTLGLNMEKDVKLTKVGNRSAI